MAILIYSPFLNDACACISVMMTDETRSLETRTHGQGVNRDRMGWANSYVLDRAMVRETALLAFKSCLEIVVGFLRFLDSHSVFQCRDVSECRSCDYCLQ